MAGGCANPTGSQGPAVARRTPLAPPAPLEKPGASWPNKPAVPERPHSHAGTAHSHTRAPHAIWGSRLHTAGRGRQNGVPRPSGQLREVLTGKRGRAATPSQGTAGSLPRLMASKHQAAHVRWLSVPSSPPISLFLRRLSPEPAPEPRTQEEGEGCSAHSPVTVLLSKKWAAR